MLIFLTILLAFGVLLALAYPMLKTAQGSASQPLSVGSSARETLQELLAQRDAAFQAIRDLKFDREVGKITDEDYVTFEAGLKLHAAEALRRLDAWEQNIDREIGRSFQAPARKTAAAARPVAQAAERPAPDPLEAQIAARRAQLARGTVPCPSCGRPVAAGNEFCTGCGAAVSAVPRQPAASKGPACPACGQPIRPDDRFCPGCGQHLGQPLRGNPVAG